MSTAWVGIHDQHDSTGTIHYFQAGYMFDGTCMDRFIEYNITDNSSLWQRSFQGICAASPDYVTSRVLYLGPPGPNPPCCSQTGMYADNFYRVVGFDGWNAGWSFNPGYFGEVNYSPSDIPGTATNVANIPAMGIQSTDTGQLRVVPCYLTPPPGYPLNAKFHYGYSGCDHIWVWTDPVTP